jgi:cell division protein FtsL
MKRAGIWLAGLLIVAIMASAVAVVYVKYQTRLLFVDLQAMRGQREALDVEWDDLRLEEASLSNTVRVERRARHQLDMHLPERREMRIIDGGTP